MMRLALVISSLRCGGAERVMTNMANYWVAKRWEISLLTFDDGAIPPFYSLDSRINHIRLGVARQSANLAGGAGNSLKRVWALRRSIRNSRPDAVISFMDKTNVATLLATRGLNLPVIVSERIDPAMQPVNKPWEYLRRITYPRADLIVVQSKAAADYFPASLQARSRVIPNPVQSAPVCRSRDSNRSSLISVGRLDQQKGFDLLLRAFACVKDRYPRWTLTILGEGPVRRQLESLRDELALGERVFLPGRVDNIYERFLQADLFVMASRYEGFPNALCEAMACGLPVISTDCPSGPRDIINDGVDGLLVANENVTALAEAMNRLMGSEVERSRLADRAPDVASRFGLEKVMGMWEGALSHVTRYSRAARISSSPALISKQQVKSALKIVDQ